ncbi:DMT family transporter [Dehalogenimonas sp. THU2]|uniref:DMT family transporter n=1 Tax=Dehalogenimonas sp. THU2 TaxID=3151121 RepID=UPI0032186AF9
MTLPSKWKTSSRLATAALLVVAAVWGSTFVVVQEAVSRMPVLDFLAVRFAVAAFVMIAIRPHCFRGMTRLGFARSTGLGLTLGLAYIAQTFGLQQTSAAISGFITGMFVVFTPLLSAVILRRKIGTNVWIAVALATAGLALLSLYGWSVGGGEILTLLCALLFALHIIGLGEWAGKHDVYGLAVIQIGFVAVISFAAGLPDGLTLPPDAATWAAVGLTAVFATAAAFLIQTWAQSLMSPARTAIIITMEPVFAGVFAVLFAGEHLTMRVIAGAALVLAAMLLVELKQAASPVGYRTGAVEPVEIAPDPVAITADFESIESA